MDAEFVAAVERAVALHGREIATIGQRTVELARIALEDSRRAGAAERLAMAAALMMLERAEDPLSALDELRGRALDVIPVDDEGSTDQMREPLELALAKIEAALLASRREDRT